MKVAYITGASRGLGRRVAERLSSEYRLVLGSLSRSADLAGAVALKGDVADPETSRRAAGEIRSRFGRLDLFVANAGTVTDRSFARITETEWDRVVDVNLRGVFNGLRAMGDLLAESNGAVIIVSSLLGRRGACGAAHYAAAKAGLMGLALSAAREWAPRVRVNVVLPGYMETSMGLAAPTAMERAREDHLMKRLSSIDDAARLVAEVASLEAVTGQVFSADGRIARW